MSEITFNNPNSKLVWANRSGQTIHVTCDGLLEGEVAPGEQIQSRPFRAVNNTAAAMTFSSTDGIQSACTIRWRTVADKFVLTRETDNSPEVAIKMVEKETQGYCIELLAVVDNPGIVIVGTVDTK